MVKKIASRTSTFAILKYMLLSIGIVLVLLLVTLLVLPRPTHKTGFLTLPLVEGYAASLNEQYAMDNENTIKPEFTRYWATVMPGKLDVMKEKLAWLGSFAHLAKAPVWSPSFFKQQVVALTAAREAAGNKGDSIVKITATPQSKIVIFGYVQGAIHSLARCLAQLKMLGIINDELAVTNPDFFIVFTGGIVSRSAHNMATLSLVCRLLEKNPQQVVYLRGTHESKGYWQEHALKNELVMFASHLGSGDIPLMNEVNAFFNTLPSAAYVTMNGPESKRFIRISDVGQGQSEQLTESNYAGFLTSKSDKALMLQLLATKAEGKDDVKIDVIFKGEKKRERYQPHQGLRLLQSDKDAVAWTTLSSPTVVYQKAIKFMHDAFVVVTAGKQIADWTVTLYNRDVRTKDPFKATVFNLITGADAATGSKPSAPDDQSSDRKDKTALSPLRGVVQHSGAVFRQAQEERADEPKGKVVVSVDAKEQAAKEVKKEHLVDGADGDLSLEKIKAVEKPAPPEPVEGRPVGVKEREHQEAQTVALDATVTSTMAHIVAIQQQLQTLTKEVTALADHVQKEQPGEAKKTVKAELSVKKDTAEKPSSAAATEDVEASAFKPM